MSRRALGMLAAVVAMALGTGAAAAPPAHLVKDVGAVQTEFPFPTFPIFSARLGGVAYFTADDGVHGLELWSSDGTAAGTAMVRDICPGECSSRLGSGEIVAMGGQLYFPADDGSHGIELWTSDGTAAGTHLLADVEPGLGGSSPMWLTVAGAALFFTADDGVHGRELWVSDGTVGGTHLVSDIQAGSAASDPCELAALGTAIVFGADAGTGFTLWTSDGSAAGTTSIASVQPNCGSGPWPVNRQDPVTLSGKVFFTGNDVAHGWELWSSDGTAAGTALVSDIDPGAADSSPSFFAVLGGHLYFSADDGTHGRELWTSDGTPAGTAPVADLEPGSGSSSPAALTVVGAQVFFFAGTTAAGREPWVSDGTSAGTHPLADLLPGPGSSLQWNFFHALGPVAGKFVFWADDGVHGPEPFASDGTTTTALGDLDPGAAGSFLGPTFSAIYPIDFGSFGLFFADAGPGVGWSLFRSDATPAGTAMLADLDTQTSSLMRSFWFWLPELTDFGGRAAFLALPDAATPNLWLSDGSGPGTSSLSAGVDLGGLQASGGRLFFAGDDAATGSELWATDGTLAGTARVADLALGPPSFSPSAFGVAGSKLVFTGQNGGVWASDGSAGGTSQLATEGLAWPTSVGSDEFFVLGSPGQLARTDGVSITTLGGPGAANLAALGSRVFFSAGDTATGQELWVSDGTPAGTQLVLDVRPGPAGSIPDVQQPGLVPISAVVATATRAFFVANDGVHGQELWVSDGTAAGTTLVADLFAGAPGSEPRELTAVGSRLFFVADDGVHGRELWVSDGTAAGTTLVRDIVPGPGSGLPQRLRAIDGALLFSASDGVHGRELWASDGTAGGTTMLQDIAPAAASSSPMEFTVAGPDVFFFATDAATGFEPWALSRRTLADLVRPGADFYTVAPCRLYDSRGGAAIAAGEERAVPVAGHCGIPPAARAVAVNVTAIGASADGFVALYAADTAAPTTSSLNFAAGAVRANNAVVQLSLDGQPALRVRPTLGAGSVDVVVDVSGYFE